MSAFACCFWWFLLGLLLGWLLNWLLSKWTRKDDSGSGSSSSGGQHFSSNRGMSVGSGNSNGNGSGSGSPAQRVMAGGANIAAAAAAGFAIKGNDDLQIVEGIGPKISELLRANGVSSFGKLSTMSVPQIAAILETGGSRFKLANPSTWAYQAQLCHENRWSELKVLQDELDGGVAVSDNS